MIVWDTAVFRTHLELIQLDPGNQPCGVASTPDTQYTITDAVHHFLVDYGPVTVAISPYHGTQVDGLCGGFVPGADLTDATYPAINARTLVLISRRSSVR